MHRALEAAGRFREALAAIEQAGGAPYRDPVADDLATDRGRLLWRNARFDEAERVLEAAYTDRCNRLGDDHPDTLATLERLAANAGYRMESDLARARFVAVIARLEGTLGAKHLRTGIAKRNYAAHVRDEGNVTDAWNLLEDAARTIARHCPRQSPEVVATLKVEALLRVSTEGADVVEAQARASLAVDTAAAVHGAQHALTAGAMLTLALAQVWNGVPQEALGVATHAGEILESSYGRHPLTAFAFERQATAWLALGDLDAALAAMRVADRMFSATYPAILLATWEGVMLALLDAKRVDEVSTEAARFLARPLREDYRGYATDLRDASRA